MAVITKTTRGSIKDLTRTILTASDTFTYTKDASQVLFIANDTAGSLTVTIKGSAPSAAFPVEGAGTTTVDLSAGKSITIAAGKTFAVALDSISSYLAGNGTVTVSGGTGAVATLIG